MMLKCARAIGVLIFSMVLVISSVAQGAVLNTLNVGSSGTVTTTFASLTFNGDPAGTPTSGATNFNCTGTTLASNPCNNDVASGTTLAFTGGPLATTEGIEVAMISAATIGDNTFLQFANHPNLVFSLTGINTNPGVSTDCATLAPGQSCVIYAGAAVLLTPLTSISTNAAITVSGKASDTGVSGLGTASSYTGGWSEQLNQTLPANPLTGFAGGPPSAANIQLYFCGTNNNPTVGQCSLGGSLTTPNSGDFILTPAATVPEPDSIALTMIGSSLIGLGVLIRRRRRA